MSKNCDDCKKEATPQKEEILFSFCQMSEDQKNRKNLIWDTDLTLCLPCFDIRYSVFRFAKSCLKNLHQQYICCTCNLPLKPTKHHIYSIRCYSPSMYLELYYCKECYANDIGPENVNIG